MRILSSLPLKVGLTAALLCGNLLPAAARPPLNLAVSTTASLQRLQRSPWQSVHYHLRKLYGAGCHVVDVDLTCRAVRVHMERSSDMGSRYHTFRSMVTHHRPLAAITGTFFDMKSGAICCNLVRQGHLLNEGKAGNTIWIDPDNRAHLLQTAQTYGRTVDWSNCDFAVSSGPTLLRHGRVALNPHSEGFHDPGLFRRAARTGLGITRYNHLLMVTVNKGISLRRFAWIMRKLGAVDALNLDGGSSTAMYCRGRFHSRPRRMLTNLVMVSARPGEAVPRSIWSEATRSPEISAPPNVQDYQDAPPEPETVEIPDAY
jgi:uncharacterized protein YigE (DUF2233 family)